MKVYVGCFGSGLGHASRVLEVAKELTTRGAELEFSSSGEVASLISRKGYRCNRLPLADVQYSPRGAMMVKESILAYPLIVGRNYQQLALEIGNIERFGPDVILSDSALPTVLAARILRLPVYTILNQLIITSSHRDTRALARLFSIGFSSSMGKLWELSDEIILPDLPPPYTISGKNLWGSKVGRVRYVGFLLPPGGSAPDAAAEQFMRDPRPKVFWQVSGPPQTRRPFLKLALESVEALSREYAFVVSGGDPGGSPVPRRIKGVWYYEWCGVADVYFRTCDVVVSRAGHGTIGQTIAASKPSLVVPIPSQPEQEGNADRAERLGISIVVKQDELTTNTLRKHLDALLGGSYAAKSMEVGRVAQGYEASKSIVNLLESAASRGHPERR